MGDRFFATHGAQIAQYTHVNLFRAGAPPEIVPAALGHDGGAIGASLLVGGPDERRSRAPPGAAPAGDADPLVDARRGLRRGRSRRCSTSPS